MRKPAIKNVPIRISPKEHERLLKLKENYAKWREMSRMTWDTYILLLSEEVEQMRQNQEKQR